VAGPPAALQREADELQAVIGKVKAIYRTRIAPDLVDKWFDGADYWMDSSEAVRSGLCTQIILAPERPAVGVANGATPAAAGDPIIESLALELLGRMERVSKEGLQRALEAFAARGRGDGFRPAPCCDPPPSGAAKNGELGRRQSPAQGAPAVASKAGIDLPKRGIHLTQVATTCRG
jgi:hypothetical protein